MLEKGIFLRGRRRKSIRRLVKIGQIALKHGFGYFLEKFGLLQLLPGGEKQTFTPPPLETIGRRLRLLLEDLGPTFVKVGQLLSVRPDLVPPDVLFELEKLQDKVPPFPFELAKKIIEEELERKIDEVFSHFNPEVIASASIGQVYEAFLKNGEKVAVKIQRPGSKEMIESDLDLFFFLSELLKERVPFIDLVGVAQEFSDSLHRELDYRIEGRHIDRFRENFRLEPLIKIPIVYWNYTTKRVLTLEYVEGTKVSDLATPERAGIDTYSLAIKGAQAFMKQVLEDGFFHGDLHPANVLITPDGKIGYLDFGIVGELKEEDKEIITNLLSGIVRQDAEKIVEEAEKLGVEIPRNKIPQMKTELKEILDRYYGRTLGELQIDIIGKEFLSLIYRHKLRIPKEYALLAKALITIEGVAKKLYPQINIIEVAKPYVYEVLRKRYSREKMVKDLYEELKKYSFYAIDLPKQVYSILGQLRRGEMQIKYRYVGLEELSSSIKEASKSISVGLVLASLIFSLPLIVLLFNFYPLWGILVLIFILLILSIFLFISRQKS